MSMENLKILAMRVRELRTQTGLTVEQLAAKLGVSPEEYRTYEDGSRQAPFSFYYNLAECSCSPVPAGRMVSRLKIPKSVTNAEKALDFSGNHAKLSETHGEKEKNDVLRQHSAECQKQRDLRADALCRLRAHYNHRHYYYHH